MSGRKRFFISHIENDQAVLDGDEFTHARTVQRVEEGTEITLLNGSGKEYDAIVTKVEKHSLSAHIIGVSEGGRDPQTPVYLLCGLLKGDKNELVVQKAAELGVEKIAFFNSRYCAAFTNANKFERLNKIAREAAKQCMRSTVPQVLYFENYRDALLSCAEYKNKLFACEFAKETQVDLSAVKGSTALIVGSEGGFAEEEAVLATENGFYLVSLGKRILRAETAAIALTSVVAFTLGELR